MNFNQLVTQRFKLVRHLDQQGLKHTHLNKNLFRIFLKRRIFRINFVGELSIPLFD